MKFVGVFIFSILLLGSEGNNLEEFGSEIWATLNDFLAPLSEAKMNDMLRNADDCLKLTNTSEQAYTLAVNVTDFGVAAVEELGNSMNALIDCSQEDIFKQLNCVFAQLQVVRRQVLEIQGQFIPYLNEVNSIYYQLVEELHECV